MTRQSIFISHATPQDNGFVRWLGARLELAGYSVWHDLGRLKGGDYFWPKIEGAIRNESFRFLAVVSKVSVEKQGVKDEWSLARTIEGSLPGFHLILHPMLARCGSGAGCPASTAEIAARRSAPLASPCPGRSGPRMGRELSIWPR